MRTFVKAFALGDMIMSLALMIDAAQHGAGWISTLGCALAIFSLWMFQKVQ